MANSGNGNRYCIAGTVGSKLMSGKPTKIDLDKRTQLDVRCQVSIKSPVFHLASIKQNFVQLSAIFNLSKMLIFGVRLLKIYINDYTLSLRQSFPSLVLVSVFC